MNHYLMEGDIQSLTIFASCLIISSFFSSSETAITSLGPLKVKHLMEKNEKNARDLAVWLKYPARVLTTILVFNNIANILASAQATVMATRHFDSQAVAIATFITTFLILIFSEIIPKSFARARSEQLAIPALKSINILYRLFYPIIWTLSEFADLMIRYTNHSPVKNPTITEDELEFLINEGEKAGVLEDTKKNMISRVFEFDEIKAREIMTPRTDIAGVEKSTPFQQVLKLSITTGHSRIPVYENRIDNIVGVIFAKDMLRHLSTAQSHADDTLIEKLMREPFFIPESKPLMEVFKDLKNTKNHMAVIIDEYGGTAGLVTMEDILEEIVGDIQDEFDSEEATILEVENGVYEVLGSITINEFIDFFDLGEKFAAELDSDVETVAGWIMQNLGDLPEVGQTMTHDPLTIEVTEISRHRIERLRVIKMLTAETIPQTEAT